jgi:hypothetical protein
VKFSEIAKLKLPPFSILIFLIFQFFLIILLPADIEIILILLKLIKVGNNLVCVVPSPRFPQSLSPHE